MRRPNTPDEHFGDVVARADAHLPYERQNQGMPFGRGEILHVARIQDGGHVGHVLQLGGGYVRQYLVAVRQRFEPGDLIQYQIKVLARRLFGRALDLVVQRPAYG